MGTDVINKPWAESCEQNKHVILEQLEVLYARSKRVLEIGSGTGQHAVHFAAHMPHLDWFCSDREENLEGISLWLEDAALNNTHGPYQLDVTQLQWLEQSFDAVFSANTLHIMSWNEVKAFFDGLPSVLEEHGVLAVYGPFNYNNEYTSESNARFDVWLKQRDPLSGIRNFEDLDALAMQAGLMFSQDIEMPVNNRILCWKKV